MTRVRVEIFSISLDGHGAGLNPDLNNPLGVGTTGIDADFSAPSMSPRNTPPT